MNIPAAIQPKLSYAQDPKAYMAEYNRLNRERRNARNKLMTPEQKQKKSIRQLRYRDKNIARERKRCLDYYYSNKPRLMEYEKKNRHKWVKYHIQYTRKYREMHPEKIKAYRKTERYKFLNQIYQNNRRAKKQAVPIGLKSEIREFYASVRAQLFVNCFYCGTLINGRAAHVEHMMPLCKGGSHDVSNFCIACRDCNLSKGKKTIEEWRAQCG